MPRPPKKALPAEWVLLDSPEIPWSHDTCRNMAKRGQLDVRLIGGRAVIRRSELAALLANPPKAPCNRMAP